LKLQFKLNSTSSFTSIFSFSTDYNTGANYNSFQLNHLSSPKSQTYEGISIQTPRNSVIDDSLGANVKHNSQYGPKIIFGYDIGLISPSYSNNFEEF
jgi:alpha-mannosidase